MPTVCLMNTELKPGVRTAAKHSNPQAAPKAGIPSCRFHTPFARLLQDAPCHESLINYMSFMYCHVSYKHNFDSRSRSE